VADANIDRRLRGVIETLYQKWRRIGRTGLRSFKHTNLVPPNARSIAFTQILF
jgi:hypothetical protein